MMMAARMPMPQGSLVALVTPMKPDGNAQRGCKGRCHSADMMRSQYILDARRGETELMRLVQKIAKSAETEHFRKPQAPSTSRSCARSSSGTRPRAPRLCGIINCADASTRVEEQL